MATAPDPMAGIATAIPSVPPELAGIATPAPTEPSAAAPELSGIATPTVASPAPELAGIATPVSDEKSQFIEQGLVQSQESIPEKAGDLVQGIGTGAADFVTQAVPGIATGAYDLATNSNLTAGQKATAAGNTVLANLVGLTDLGKNAATGATNMATGAYRSLTGNPETDDEMRAQYGKWYDKLQEQAAQRRDFLTGGVAALANVAQNKPGYDPTLLTPPTANAAQEKLSPLLDVTNLIPFGAGAASRLGATLWKNSAQQIDKTMLQKALMSVGKTTEHLGEGTEAVRQWLPQALQNIGVPEHIAVTWTEPERLAVLVGVLGGGLEHGAAVLAGEALPSTLIQTGRIAQSASRALQSGEGTVGFFERMAQTTTGFPQAIFKALDDTGIGTILGGTGKLVGSTLHGGLVNPFVPLQFLASNGNMDEFGQQLGANLGFAGLGATIAIPFAEQSAGAIAARNLADRLTYLRNIGQNADRYTRLQTTPEEQISLYNELAKKSPQTAQLIAAFTASRPDILVKLDPTTGASWTQYMSDLGRRVMVINPNATPEVGAHIASHEFVHFLTMLPDVAQKISNHLLGNRDLQKPGLLGVYDASGAFKPNAEFSAFIKAYADALANDKALVPFSPLDTQSRNVPYDQDAHMRYMANEFLAESLAPYLAGTNKKGETGFSHLYRRNDALSKFVGSVAERFGGSGIREYLDRKYAQGRYTPRFGAKEAAQAYGGEKMSGLVALGLEAARAREPMGAKKPEYANPSGPQPQIYGMNELMKAPDVAIKAFGASNNLVFDKNGALLGFRPEKEAEKLSRKQAAAVFDALAGQVESTLPDGAIRKKVVTDAKGKQTEILSGKFFTDRQLDAIGQTNSFNKWQMEALRKLNETMKNPGEAYDLIYQTASARADRKKYATLASSHRTIVPYEIVVTRAKNVIVRSLDLDQFHTNYGHMVDALHARGKQPVIAPQDISKAISDYLLNQSEGYTGQGVPADPAHPPTNPPARVFTLDHKHFLNELFGITTKDNAGVNLHVAELQEEGIKRSTSAVKSFRLDRMNDLNPTGIRAPFEYPKVKQNFSPEEETTKHRHAAFPHIQADERFGGHPVMSFDENAAKYANFDPAMMGDEVTQVKATQEALRRQYAQAEQNRHLQFSPASELTAPREGDESVRKLADNYRKNISGLPPHSGYAQLIPALSKQVADAYEALKSNPNDPAVKASYQAFIDETLRQFNHAQQAGYTFEPWTQPGQPYATSKEMLQDVRDNKHLYYFPTDAGFGETTAGTDHPLLRPVNGIVPNDAFRAIHDLYGHAQNGYEFGPRGELNAFLEHRGMYSDTARPAMTAETMGQNSWVNFGRHLRNAEGEIPKRGELGFVPPQDRPFAEQKAALLPANMQGAIDVAYSPEDKIPFEVVTHRSGKYPEALHKVVARLGAQNDQDPIRTITHATATALAKLPGLHTIKPSLGGWFNPDEKRTEVSPNLIATFPPGANAEQFMRAVTQAAHQSQGNVFRVPKEGETATNGALAITLPKDFSEDQVKALMQDLAKIRDSANQPLLTGFTLFPNGTKKVMTIGDQFYTAPEGSTFRKELDSAAMELDKYLANYTIPRHDAAFQKFNISTFDNPEGGPSGGGGGPADRGQAALRTRISGALNEALDSVQPNYRAFSPGDAQDRIRRAGRGEGRVGESRTGGGDRGPDNVPRGGSGPSSPKQWFQRYITATGRSHFGAGTDENADHLLTYAAKTGNLISPMAIHGIQRYAGKGGVEHEVFLVPEHAMGHLTEEPAEPNTIVKIVKPGKWGLRRTDLEYFKSLHDLDTLTGGLLNYKILGVTPKGTWPSVVSSMNFIPGKAVDRNGMADGVARVKKYLEARGFEQVPGSPTRFTYPGTDVMLIDAHGGNFIERPDGTYVPIDLIIRGDVRKVQGALNSSNTPKSAQFGPDIAEAAAHVVR